MVKRRKTKSDGVYELMGHHKKNIGSLKRRGLIKKGKKYDYVLSAKGQKLHKRVYK